MTKIEQKQNNKEINFNSNFFDSCLSLNENDNILIDNNMINSNINNNSINKNISNKENSNSVSNILNNKEISNNNILLSNDKKDSFIENNGIKIPENSLDFDENIFPKFNDKTNDSIIINKYLSINENGDCNNNVDEFDAKINEDIISNNSNENFKIKNDIFYSNNNINESINVNNVNNLNIDDNICNLSTGKDIEIINKKVDEKDNHNKSEDINIYNSLNNIEINEICNLSVKEKESLNNNTITQEKNNNQKIEIKNNDNNNKEIKDNNILIKEINGIETTKNNSNKSRNENFQIYEENNKVFFDSLENITHPNNKTNETYHEYNNNLKKNKNIDLIQNNKIKILNQFLTLEKIPLKKNYNTPKKCKFQISETNNIFLSNNTHKKKNDSFYCTNQAKVENIFIKGENKSQYKTESKSQKNLELFTIDKNDNIFIKHNTDKNKNININENIMNNFNTIQERLIDSKMIINFLNNSKNEPMFPSKNYSTIDETSKRRLNLNKNKTKNYTNLKNISQDKKNHFYLKKKIINNGLDNNNINKLNINEKELIEPNIQICPVSNSNINNKNKSKEINGIYDKLKNENIIEDLLKIKKRKNFLKSKSKKNSKHNLSYDMSGNNIIEQNVSSSSKKDHSISNDLIEFINKAKKNNKRNSDLSSGEIYSFKTIKYDKFNTYRENLNKKKIMHEKTRKNKIVMGNLVKFGINKNNSNKNIKKNLTKNNSSFGSNKKSYVDYKRLNELYLDYKIKNIKRNKLRKEQDLKNGITFMPNTNINKYINNYIN